jgi:glycosyltransferase involved in cell wall biosynthesis
MSDDRASQASEGVMDVSVVCPFYNEAGILEDAVRALLSQLQLLPHDWELIIVNDGSTDDSEAIARGVAASNPRLRVLGYRPNRGRGHALRVGIAAARGDIIVTTEIDLSWGDTIVHELVAEIHRYPDTDMVVASPHLAGGGYRNVPFKRVMLSRVGNMVIRACMTRAATMNTGMTRAYRREMIQSLPLTEDGKEFHLEVILKATTFGARVREIPAMLEWKEYKHKGLRVKRKSSSRVKLLIVSHSLFSLFANPVRYVWAMSLGSLIIGFGALVWAMIELFRHEVSIYMALLSVSMVILGIVLFVMGVVLHQGNIIQRELWSIQRLMLAPRKDQPAPDLTTESDSRRVPTSRLGV